ncbi:hypothetical protein SDC9_49202 [bioreactor metagenome]|uniref:Collagen-like protein n=1 Tax=bioreactor metagenome TaxID=1076179 RepID=A0A644WKK4_9ZZZZ
MKNLKIFAVLLFVMGMITASCEGPEGPRGPAGAAGTNGTDGNANVVVYGFPGVTMSTSTDYTSFTLPVSSGMLDSSIVLPYFYQYNWYQAGSLGYGGYYNTRYWINTFSSLVGIGITNPDGTTYTGTDQIWDSVRIFLIPANQFYAAEPEVDFTNYYEVQSYFNQK